MGNGILRQRDKKVKATPAKALLSWRHQLAPTRDFMAQFRVSQESYARIMLRQAPDRWGSKYDAAIHATPKEAPGISTGTILRVPKFGGRAMHLLSSVELRFALLALYNPNVWEIHEQRILSPGPREHLLHGHPLAVGLQFPPFPGTVQIADRLGELDWHPRFIDRRSGNAAEHTRRAFPLIGDLLLFVSTGKIPHLVNWNIKDKQEDFRQRTYRGLKRFDAFVPEQIELRHKVEELYYAEARARTEFLDRSKIPDELFYNLRELFGKSTRPLNIANSTWHRCIDIVRKAVDCQTVGFVAIERVAREAGLSTQEANLALHHGIWKREVRVDLFRPIVMDRPLRAETVDVLEHFHSWFAP